MHELGWVRHVEALAGDVGVPTRVRTNPEPRW